MVRASFIYPLVLVFLTLSPSGRGQHSLSSVSGKARPESKNGTGVEQIVKAIDVTLSRYWKEAGITPAPLVDDLSFLRRASFDFQGRIPSRTEIDAFLSQPESKRRGWWCEKVMDKNTYLQTTWKTKPESFDRGPFGEAAYDPGISIADAVRRSALENGRLENGENHPLDNKRTTQSPVTEWYGGHLLGHSINCAECHDHPFVPELTNETYWAFNAFFQDSGGQRPSLPLKYEHRDIPGSEATVKEVFPQYFGKGELKERAKDDFRKDLVEWIAKDPRFAKAMVNRHWGMFFGRALNYPLDSADLRLDSQGNLESPVVPGLLEAVTHAFNETGQNLQALSEAICKSEAYQRAPGNDSELNGSQFAFQAMSPKVLSQEQVQNSIESLVGVPAQGIMEMRPTPIGVERGVHADFSVGTSIAVDRLSRDESEFLSFLVAASAPWKSGELSAGDLTEEVFLTLLTQKLPSESLKAFSQNIPQTSALDLSPGGTAEQNLREFWKVFSSTITDIAKSKDLPALRISNQEELVAASLKEIGKAKSSYKVTLASDEATIGQGSDGTPLSFSTDAFSNRSEALRNMIWAMLQSSAFAYNY
jgi:hypothetical protein